jgi:hypothetical protein
MPGRRIALAGSLQGTPNLVHCQSFMIEISGQGSKRDRRKNRVCSASWLARGTFFAAATLLLAGCAPMSWHRPDTDAAATAQDFEDCQRIGHLNASQVALASPQPSAPVVITTPSGATAVQSSPLPVRGLDPTLALQVTTECMRKKGYTLVRSK